MLTTNLLVFSLDSRLGVSLEPGQNNWGLVIQSAQERDSASYLCQVSPRSEIASHFTSDWSNPSQLSYAIKTQLKLDQGTQGHISCRYGIRAPIIDSF